MVPSEAAFERRRAGGIGFRASDGRPILFRNLRQWLRERAGAIELLSFGWQANIISSTQSLCFYAYVLESLLKPGEYYRGHTEDLKQRLAEHNTGKCPHTSKYAPWKVKFYAALETLKLARDFETYLKSGSGHAFARKHLGL